MASGKFDGAPDPKLGFGRNGYVKSTQFSGLKSNSGKQTHEIPSSIVPADYTEVWVWCEKYSLPLGVAALKSDKVPVPLAPAAVSPSA